MYGRNAKATGALRKERGQTKGGEVMSGYQKARKEDVMAATVKIRQFLLTLGCEHDAKRDPRGAARCVEAQKTV
jgi:hypothetical protein